MTGLRCEWGGVPEEESERGAVNENDLVLVSGTRNPGQLGVLAVELAFITSVSPGLSSNPLNRWVGHWDSHSGLDNL